MFVLTRLTDGYYYIGAGRWSGMPKLYRSREALQHSVAGFILDEDWRREYDRGYIAGAGLSATEWVHLRERAWERFVERHEDIFAFLSPRYQLREIRLFDLDAGERAVLESGLWLLVSNPDIPEDNKVQLRTAASKLGLSTLES